MIDAYPPGQRRRHHHDFHKPQHTHHPQVPENGGSTRRVKVVRRVLDVNDQMAAGNRKLFTDKGIFVLNLMSSPGSGKTTLLEKSLGLLMPALRCAVIVGDICTTHDADRIADTGAPVVQINTEAFGGDCHLAAHVIEKAASGLDLDGLDLLIVENVGNLVCPAEFDLGEDLRVVVLSVTEGEEKPIKYPLMFRQCQAVLLNKIDLLPYLDYDKTLAKSYIHQIHPRMPIFEVSAKTTDGINEWLDWLKKKVEVKSKSVD